MKKQNLTRSEAMKAMIDGYKIGHTSIMPNAYLFHSRETIDGDYRSRFYLKSPYGSVTEVAHLLNPAKDYYIIKPEPTFKEVTMYAPVVWIGTFGCSQRTDLYERPDEAMKHCKNTKGYTEVKVFLKEDEV